HVQPGAQARLTASGGPCGARRSPLRKRKRSATASDVSGPAGGSAARRLKPAEERAMSDRPPRVTWTRDRPTWVVALWLVLFTLVAGMAPIGGMIWVLSRRF